MEEIKINYTFEWRSFDPKDNYFTKILSRKYKVKISDNPDLLICADDMPDARIYLNYDCHKLSLNFENQRPDWTAFDYILGSDYLPSEPRYKRLPIWALGKVDELLNEKKTEEILASKKKFACMVVSNPEGKERNFFFKQLSKYKKVDSGGQFLNNVGGPVKDKMAFIKEYKFVLSFENSCYPGYSSEKIIDPMNVNSLPIHWGDPLIGNDFNKKSFICVHDFKDFDAAINHIIELDQNCKSYLEKLSQPWFRNNKLPEFVSADSVFKYLDFVIQDMKTRTPVSKTSKKYIHMAKLKTRNLIWSLSKKDMNRWRWVSKIK